MTIIMTADDARTTLDRLKIGHNDKTYDRDAYDSLTRTDDDAAARYASAREWEHSPEGRQALADRRDADAAIKALGLIGVQWGSLDRGRSRALLLYRGPKMVGAYRGAMVQGATWDSKEALSLAEEHIRPRAA